MKQRSGPGKAPAEQVPKDIRRQPRRPYSAEKKVHVVMEGLRGEANISDPCRREGIAAPRIISEPGEVFTSREGLYLRNRGTILMIWDDLRSSP